MCEQCYKMNNPEISHDTPKDPSRRSFLKKSAAGAGITSALSTGAISLLPNSANAGGEVWSPNRIQWWPDVPNIITRAEWGCNEALRESQGENPIFNDKVQKIAFHHTVTPNGQDPYSAVRGIYASHVSGEFYDIAYHYLISSTGLIFEGRWSAWDHWGKDFYISENVNRENVRGAHALSANTNSIGIAFLGTYSYGSPSPAALNAAASLAAWKCARWGINPLASDVYVDGRVFPNLHGHRDVYQTTCPGNYWNSWLPGIRQSTANIINSKGYYAWLPGSIEHTSNDGGYIVGDTNGHIVNKGNAVYSGDATKIPTQIKFTATKFNPAGTGYWILASSGYVANYGGAGSFGRCFPNQGYFVGIAGSNNNTGYYLLNDAGVVYNFGAPKERHPGMLNTGKKYSTIKVPKTGPGYWVLAEDGQVFATKVSHFGDATGQAAGRKFVDMALTKTQLGYYLLRDDGRIFNFGDAPALGSPSSPHPFVGIAATKSSSYGYSVLNARGEIFCFGSAVYRGNA